MIKHVPRRTQKGCTPMAAPRCPHPDAQTFCGRVPKRLQRTQGAGTNAESSAAVRGLDSEGRARFGGLEQY